MVAVITKAGSIQLSCMQLRLGLYKSLLENSGIARILYRHIL